MEQNQSVIGDMNQRWIAAWIAYVVCGVDGVCVSWRSIVQFVSNFFFAEILTQTLWGLTKIQYEKCYNLVNLIFSN